MSLSNLPPGVSESDPWFTDPQCDVCGTMMEEDPDWPVDGDGRCSVCVKAGREVPLECLDAVDGNCQGPVRWHSTDPGVRPAFPRCDRHWDARCATEERLRRDYPDSPIAPSWFDPANAGETWDED